MRSNSSPNAPRSVRFGSAGALLFVLATCASSPGASAPPAPASPGRAAAVKLSFSSDPALERMRPFEVRWDLGRIDATAPRLVRRAFVFRNPGPKAIAIHATETLIPWARASLRIPGKGAVASQRVKPLRLQPGVPGRLELTLDLARLVPGRFDNLITLHGPAEPAATLAIAGEIDAGAAFLPEMLAFPKVAAGSSPALTFRAVCDARLAPGGIPPAARPSNSDLVITPEEGAGELSAADRASLPPGLRDRPLVVRAYRVTLSPQSCTGLIQETITLAPAVPVTPRSGAPKKSSRAAPDPGHAPPHTPLSVTGYIEGALTAAPEFVLLPPAEAGQEVVLPLSLTGTTAAVFEGLKFRSTNPWLTVRLSPPDRPTPGGNGPDAQPPPAPQQSGSGPARRMAEIALSSHAPVGPIDARIEMTLRSGQRYAVRVLGVVTPKGKRVAAPGLQ